MSLEVDRDRQRLRALSHPVRLRILSLTSGAAMSSAELARELGMNHAAVSFHVRQLAAAGFLALAQTRSVRGGQERRYRYLPSGPANWEEQDARLAVQAMSAEVLRRLADAASVRWRLFADAELWVDPAIWAAAAAQIAAAVNDLQAAAQPPHAPGALQVSASAILFAADAAGGSPVGSGPASGGETGSRRKASGNSSAAGRPASPAPGSQQISDAVTGPDAGQGHGEK